jgi:hypothetical protein
VGGAVDRHARAAAAVNGFLVPGAAKATRRLATPPAERDVPADPVKYTRDVLNAEPWSVQREVMRAVVAGAGEGRVAVPACNGPGKTKMASWLAASWLEGAPIGERFVVTTAPSEAQVKGLLWREIVRAKFAGGLPGTITGLTGSGPVEWYVGQELVAWGRRPRDMADPEQARQAFSGVHATAGVLVILDEATGIPPWLWQAAIGLLTNEASRIVALGNPDDPSSTFAEKCAPGSGWWVRHISAFETPNFTGEPVSPAAAAGLVSKRWVENARQDFGGVDAPLYQSRVGGVFPDRSDDLVVQPRHVREAWELDLPGRVRGAFGYDVARSPTGDDSALYRHRGGVLRYVDHWKGLPITAKPGEPSGVDRVLGHLAGLGNVPVVVDTDGLGAGALDGLLAEGVNAVPFTAAGPARRPDRFDSRRTELWWEARTALERGEWDLDPGDLVLAAQLQTPRFWAVRGRIHVETKQELAKRGKPSPDRADAAIMAAFGAPIDLRGTGAMGEGAPRPTGKGSAGGVPDALRVKRGEGAGLRRRPM